MAKKTTQRKTSKLLGRVPTPADDFKTAVLLVSLAINVAVFTGWLAIKLTTQFDSEVANFLFN